jgi:UDP-galactopyranose mutase
MSRAAQSRRVFFVEEPDRRGRSAMVEAVARDGLMIVRPVVPESVPDSALTSVVRDQLDRFLASEGVTHPWLWYYTPMALPWTDHIQAEAVVYDCMDELSGFKFAPNSIRDLERRLLGFADVVFTGGRSLYEAKRAGHRNTFLFPSSVDANHFRQARAIALEPADQASLGRPRIGYFGVIDERIDLDLIRAIAHARPDWEIVMVGPLAKIGDDELPQADNIHWLGRKQYEELPAYLGGWDVAIMPFALNDSTRHISPTKTPEYLSGGRPVVSTPIHDVVHPYGDEGLVAIASNAAEFVACVERALGADRDDLIRRADRFLGSHSWDATWSQMEQLINELRPQHQLPDPPAADQPGAHRPRPDRTQVPRPSPAGTATGSGGGGLARSRQR